MMKSLGAVGVTLVALAHMTGCEPKEAAPEDIAQAIQLDLRAIREALAALPKLPPHSEVVHVTGPEHWTDWGSFKTDCVRSYGYAVNASGTQGVLTSVGLDGAYGTSDDVAVGIGSSKIDTNLVAGAAKASACRARKDS